MYPAMIEDAKAEGNNEALRTFKWANAVEEVHAKLYRGLMDGLGKSLETYPYYVCPVCGYTHEKEAPDVCPVCGTRGKLFKRID
jgi:rubrerythrin